VDSFLEIRHNMEVAHRLFNLKGRCEQIHGHSMWVTVRIYGKIDNEVGAVTNHYGRVMDFGSMKKGLRHHMDTVYDHHLLLNRNDPFAGPLYLPDAETVEQSVKLPGLQVCDGDPTTENLALWIAQWGRDFYGVDRIQCIVQETAVNAAGVILGGE
jgi:6-pyruvoyltetrahydropterin/6-carboxytetrahydropterin synthase